jgi:hypothetical protein
MRGRIVEHTVHAVNGVRRTNNRTESLETLVVALVTIVLVAVMFATGPGESANDRPTVSQVRVHKGDTPWGLARAYPVDGLTTAETADLIVSLNGGKAGVLRAGDSVWVPTVASDSTELAMR